MPRDRKSPLAAWPGKSAKTVEGKKLSTAFVVSAPAAGYKCVAWLFGDVSMDTSSDG
jgi:hypothetical protein